MEEPKVRFPPVKSGFGRMAMKVNFKKIIIMGRYVSYGIVRTYRFYKDSIRELVSDCSDINENDIKEALMTQIFPDIYDFIETDKVYEFTLKSDLSVKDLVELITCFWDIAHIEESDREGICEAISEMSFDAALDLAEEKQFYDYMDFHLYGRFRDEIMFAYPIIIDGERGYLDAEVFGVIIEQSYDKTLSESNICPYDFFTELLRYRLKPCKLADSALVFLSQ